MKKVFIVLIAIGILAICGVAQVALFSSIYGKDGTLMNSMATLQDKIHEPGASQEPVKTEKPRNMNPGDSCGNGLCEIEEYHYNCPQDC